MFIRALFMLLLALNIGGASWLLFANHPQAEEAAATDPGVPRLELLAPVERVHDLVLHGLALWAQSPPDAVT